MKRLDQALLDQVVSAARSALRQRSNFNFHPTLDDRVQRFINAMEPQTYVCPHRHEGDHRWEMFLALAGRAVILTFSDEGEVLTRTELSASGPVRGLEIPGNTWHTLVSLESGTVLFETKEGPYHATSDKDFAPWAPREGDAHCAALREWFRQAEPGMQAPAF